MSPERKTAFLVIHGNLPHEPYDALDLFATGFCNTLRRRDPQIQTEPHHELQPRTDWAVTGTNWVQSYLSWPMPENRRTIDFYEYYWDIHMVHEVSSVDVIRWLVMGSKGIRQLSKDTELLAEAMDVGLFRRSWRRRIRNWLRRLRHPSTALKEDDSWEFAPVGYLRLLGLLGWAVAVFLPYVPLAARLLEAWADRRIPLVGSLLRPIVRFAGQKIRHVCGDLVRYIVVDPRSEHYETRHKILGGAVAELHELTARYDEVIIAAHSLGSVIAYDALNRILLDVNAAPEGTREERQREASRIVGLVTFGSPLDKVACFFRARIIEDRHLQRRIIANLRGFRFDAERFVGDESDIDIGDPMDFRLDDTRWLNFYHNRDWISGRLGLYDLRKQRVNHPAPHYGNGNIRIAKEFSRTKVHSCYWGAQQGENRGTDEMYEHIIDEFFREE
jgi:hypothetical protein